MLVVRVVSLFDWRGQAGRPGRPGRPGRACVDAEPLCLWAKVLGKVLGRAPCMLLRLTAGGPCTTGYNKQMPACRTHSA